MTALTFADPTPDALPLHLVTKERFGVWLSLLDEKTRAWVEAAEFEGGATTRAITHILARAKAAKIPTGIFCGNGDVAKRRLDEGFDLVTPGNDFNTLMDSMQREIAKALAWRKHSEP